MDNVRPLHRPERRRTATILDLSPIKKQRTKFIRKLNTALRVLDFSRHDVVTKRGDYSSLRETGWIFILFDGGTSIKPWMDIVMRQRTDRIIVIVSEHRSDEEYEYMKKLLDPRCRRSRSEVEVLDLHSFSGWMSTLYRLIGLIARSCGEQEAIKERRRDDQKRQKLAG